LIQEGPPTDLSWYVDRLGPFLMRELPDTPNWQSVLIAEGIDIRRDRVLRVARALLLLPDAYTVRFHEIVTTGYSWINFHAAGLIEGSLLVVVSLPTEIVGAAWTSVNLSGPPRFVRAEPGWDLSRFLHIE